MKKSKHSKPSPGSPPIIREQRVKLGAPSFETRVYPNLTKKDLQDSLLRHCQASHDQLAAVMAKQEKARNK